MQSLARWGCGGAVWAGGVAGAGGACALAMSEAANTDKNSNGRIIHMQRKRSAPAEVP
jgi:hypothetical protein